MLRLLIGTGVLLMAVGFGAAGWQYWQTLPKTAATEPAQAAADPAAGDEATPVAAKGPASPRQTWLISPTGGLIPQDEVRAYLAQGGFAPGRSLRIEWQAKLSDLLRPEEKLPEPAFLEVLADIRAPLVAEGLCPILLETIAADCAVHSARVVEGSVDQVQGTAQFQLELAFRLKDDGAELPDLAARVLRSQVMPLALDPAAEAPASPEAALRKLLADVALACAAEGVGENCRPMRMAIDWGPGQAVQARAEIAWLDPLPQGMFQAPPLGPGSGG